MTEPLPKPHHASRHAEWRSIRVQTGTSVTSTLGFARPLFQERLSSVNDRAGNPVSTWLVFPHPLVQTELRFSRAVTGSPVTALVAFSHPLKLTTLRWTQNYAGSPVTERIAFYRLPKQTASLKWASGRKAYETAMIRLRNDYNNYSTASICYRFDWKRIFSTLLQYRHRSLVPPGWRIIAKNIETGESFDLGFIDAEELAVPSQTASPSSNPASVGSLTDIYLPDGDYEVSVLTSSLFWRDCFDREIRTIYVRPGEEITPLPTVYNLRSAVSEGVTTIRWSANHSEFDDCVFGVWYDSKSPVDINRPSDATVWYFSSQTEYATTFQQNAPAWVAIAAMRTGNEPEIGKVHELYLDWSNVPPRRPDDVMVLDVPIIPFDETMESRHDGDPFWSLWNG